MITPINFSNTYKVQNINRQNTVLPQNKCDSISFGSKRIEDENSQQVYKALRAGKFSDAVKILDDKSFDFNPNWTSLKTGLPLLAAIYYPESLSAKLNGKFTKKHVPEIISRIIIHPQFEPNRTFNVRIPPENGRRMSYHELALKNKDIYLLQMLGAYGATLDDFSREELKKLESYIKDDGFQRFLLYTVFADQPSYIAHNKELQRKITRLEKTAKQARAVLSEISTKLQEAEKEGKPINISEEAIRAISTPDAPKTAKPPKRVKIDELEEYKVELSDSIPSSLDELGGMVEAKKAINNFIVRPWNAKTRALLKSNNVDMPNGFLMYGPPGCGKTYVAKVIAKQLGLPMYEVELGSVGDSYAYTTNNNLKKIFTELEKYYKKTGTPTILFLDEIDSVACARTLSRSDWKRDEINTLISLLNNSSEKGIIVIGATNLVENVDEAVLRPGRFDKKIEIPLPDRVERKEILEKLIASKPIISGLAANIDELADLTDGKTCSDISASLNVCARNAIYDERSVVTKDDFVEAMKEIEYEKNGRKIVGFSCK